MKLVALSAKLYIYGAEISWSVQWIGYGLKPINSGSIPDRGTIIFPSSTAHTGFGAHPVSNVVSTEIVSLGLRWLTTNNQVKKLWRYNSTLSYAFVACRRKCLHGLPLFIYKPTASHCCPVESRPTGQSLSQRCQYTPIWLFHFQPHLKYVPTAAPFFNFLQARNEFPPSIRSPVQASMSLYV